MTSPSCEQAQSLDRPTVRLGDGPFGLLTMPSAQHKLMSNNSGDLSMHRTLVMAILSCLIASAHAHPKTTSSIVKPEAVTQATLQKNSEVVKVRSTRDIPVTPAVKESTPAAESRWGKYGTLLAALVVMCAIALRRQRLGRP